MQSWGRIDWSETMDDPEDPVIKLLKQLEEIDKNFEWEDGEPYEAYEHRKMLEKSNIEKQISDIIYGRKIKSIQNSLR